MIFKYKRGHGAGIQINLLKKKELKLSEKLVFFSLHYLRYIIIITQMCVIMVFFYRFYIDQQIIDLKESIAQQEEIVKVTVSMVEEAQAIDIKSDEIKKLIKDQDKFEESLNYTLSVIPSKIIIGKFEQSKENIMLSGISTDYGTIRILYERLKKDNKFKKIIISEISKRFNEYEFSILINI